MTAAPPGLLHAGPASCRACRGEGEKEGGAVADGAVGPGAPAVPFDDPRDAGQADAGTGNSAASCNRSNEWNSLLA